METSDYYKNDLSLEDAVAMLMGHSLWEYRRARVDLLGHLEEVLGYALHDLQEAEEAADEAEILTAKQAAETAKSEFDQAVGLYNRLCGEVSKIRQGITSTLVLAHDPEGQGYDLVELSRQSLLEWAQRENIDVESRQRVPARKYTTPLMDLMDELIREFWDKHDPQRPPTNETMKAYIKEQYGEWKTNAPNATGECRIPGLSKKVVEAILKIIRPPE